MQDARDDVHRRLSQLKSFLAQEQTPRLSESDTKANFIEPIILALGWEGIGVVTREYYVRNSQEFIDYVMRGPDGLLLAIEAKPLRADLSDKHAAQLIQYCAVEGIEWAALTNGRELQFFNTFLKPDLAAKRVLQLDLLAYNTDEEFDALFGQIWQLSRESMTKPRGVRTWLNQRRLDTALRGVLLDPSSATIRHLRRILSDQDISANSQEVAQWFRTHLAPPVTVLQPGRPRSGEPAKLASGSGSPPEDGEAFIDEISAVRGAREVSVRLCLALREAVDDRIPAVSWRATKQYVAADVDGDTFLAVRFRANRIMVGFALAPDRESPRFTGREREFNWARITKSINIEVPSEIDADLLAIVDEARAYAEQCDRKVGNSEPERGANSNSSTRVMLRDLISAGLIEPGTRLMLVGRGGQVVARAELAGNGDVVWNGQAHRSLSGRTFSDLVGWNSMNGWIQWFAELPDGRVRLESIRDRYLQLKEQETDSLSTMG